MSTEKRPSVQDDVRAVVYREVADLVLLLPLRYRPQDVAAVLVESADQLAQNAGSDS